MQLVAQATFLELLLRRWPQFLQQGIEHIQLVLAALAVATVIGVALAVATYHRERPAALVLAVTSAILTLPSFALFGILIAPFGLGFTPAWIALIAYALMPIVRNTIVGLRGVEPEVVESARGMGMSRSQQLRRIELPLAWPVILAGVRISALLIVSIAAIAALVGGPGLGQSITGGLDRVGGAGAVPLAVGGTIGIIIVAYILDAFFVLLGRLTTPRGIRRS
jgi:osmoprotectant transport system permease protein